MKYKNGIAERDGKWYIRYRTNERNLKGKKKEVQLVCPIDIKTRSLAKRYREQQIQLVYQGKIGIGKDALFLEVLNHFKAETVDKGLSTYNKMKISGKTIETSKNNINMISNLFGNYKLLELSVHEIEKIFNKQYEIKRTKAAQASGYRNMLKYAMNFAIRQPEYDIHVNPADHVNLVYDTSKTKIVPFETQDITNIINYFIFNRDRALYKKEPGKQGSTLYNQYMNQRNLAIIIFGAFHGLRRSEICALQWKDLHFDFGVMEINGIVDERSFTQVEEGLMSREKMDELNWITDKGLIPLKDTDYKLPDANVIRVMYKDRAKTDASIVSDHPLHRDWINELIYLKELQSELMNQKNLVQSNDDFVFSPLNNGGESIFKSKGHNGDFAFLKKPISPKGINAIMTLLKKHEFVKEGQTTHTLRHYYGSQLVAMLHAPMQTDSSGNVIPNPSLPQLAKFMRHSDAGETLMRTYAHAFEQSYQENKFEWMSSIGKADKLRVVSG